MVFFMETKINKVQMEKVRRSLGFLNDIDVSVEGSRGGINLAWKEGISVFVRSFSIGHIDADLEDKENSVQWQFSGYYGSLYAQNKDEAWNVLRGLSSNQSLSWLVCGD